MARVEDCHELVERLRRRAVRAHDDVAVGRDVIGQPTVIGLEAHHVRVGVRDGCVAQPAAGAFQADREGARHSTTEPGSQAAEARQERGPVDRVPERRVDEYADGALQLASREPAELLVSEASRPRGPRRR